MYDVCGTSVTTQMFVPTPSGSQSDMGRARPGRASSDFALLAALALAVAPGALSVALLAEALLPALALAYTSTCLFRCL